MFTLTPLRRRDIPAAAAFFRDASREDPAIHPLDDDQFAAFVARPSHAGGRDFRVARVGDRVAGVLVSTPVEKLRLGRRVRHFRPAVHPAFRGRGIGSAMLRTVERQRLNGPDPTLQCCVPSSWKDLGEFLRRRGFEGVRRDLDMVRTSSLPVVAPAQGRWRLRPFGYPGDAEAWSALHAVAYADDFHHVSLTPAGVAVEASVTGFHAWVAVVDEVVVGICQTVPESGGGVVASLAVSPAWRRRGLGRALLRAGLGVLHSQGHRRVQLSVRGDNRAAHDLYVSEGFTPLEEVTTLWRSLRASPVKK
jgi:ribosomal protein S18 acetylase RimI-like enzyme